MFPGPLLAPQQASAALIKQRLLLFSLGHVGHVQMQQARSQASGQRTCAHGLGAVFCSLMVMHKVSGNSPSSTASLKRATGAVLEVPRGPV